MSEKVFEALRERVKSESYAKLLGLELVKVESGYALIRMAFTERHHNIYSRCHGGASSRSSTKPSRSPRTRAEKSRLPST